MYKVYIYLQKIPLKFGEGFTLMALPLLNRQKIKPQGVWASAQDLSYHSAVVV